MTPFLALAILLSFILGMLWPPLRRQHKRLFAVIAVVFFAAGFALYSWFGSPRLLPLLAAHEARMQEARQVIKENSALVKDKPDNLPAWIRLAEALAESGQYEPAVNAYRQAVLLSGGNPVLIEAYAEAQIAAAGGKVTDEANRGLDMVLMLKPDNAGARYWKAVRLLQDGHTQEAMQAMKTLYRSLPEDSPVRAQINRQIGR